MFFADARLAASIMSNNSKRFSVGGKVDWIKKILFPRTVSSNEGANSPSLKRFSATFPSGSPQALAIFSARTFEALPENIFISGVVIVRAETNIENLYSRWSLVVCC